MHTCVLEIHTGIRTREWPPQLAENINGNHVTRLDGLQTLLGKDAARLDFVLQMGCT
jgi:hypothetical protein